MSSFRPRVAALGALLALAAACGPAASAETMIEVLIDHARIVEIDRPATTVIVGNPAIVDVEVLNSERLVLTGRSYGITNLVVLDDKGRMIVDEQVGVQSFEDRTVRVYRQSSRMTYACVPNCQPTVTIGDNVDAFDEAAKQYQSRESMAKGSAAN
ncbi:pilus assembly protein N-terminal domain-containing protein [Aurantimonas sp. Leaf443]|uniref:pilus assembly protein N-terminal domain-containing protein n=1 Tax=Aurantimonas sp. Leaf443 TaxID=1736378 RepID=UPI0006FDE618|nr:pilus assembly protein N-terminal domain-containing protein [Aurantimonas sp. Leaf443]KQT83055.1 pilus assembly protein CpaC [Aurantimonas sp. Leaf443]